MMMGQYNLTTDNRRALAAVYTIIAVGSRQ